MSVIATRQQIGRSVARKPSRGSTAVSEPPKVSSGSAQMTLPSAIAVEHSTDAGSASDDSFFAVARDIIQEDGITGLWLGIHSSLVLTINPAITYGVFERVKSIFTRGDPTVKLGPWRAFVVGALSKSLATIVIIVLFFLFFVFGSLIGLQATYPYIMAKVRVQAHGSKPEETEDGKASAPRYNGALDVLRKVYKSEGFIGWYQVSQAPDW